MARIKSFREPINLEELKREIESILKGYSIEVKHALEIEKQSTRIVYGKIWGRRFKFYRDPDLSTRLVF